MHSSRQPFSVAYILFFFIPLLMTISPSAAANANSKGWRLLLDNKPEEAKGIFNAITVSSDVKIAAEAYRGLSEVESYLGNDPEACRNYFLSYLKDNNELYITCPIIKMVGFSHMAWGHRIKEGYRVIQHLSRTPGLFTGQSQEDLAARYLNDGNIKKAKEIVQNMGCILDWRFIGPFDNISHSGYDRIFPPETEIDFKKSYPGKDGNQAKWYRVVANPTSPWIFVENHIAFSNAVNYFYCTVESPTDREVQLSFGASGMFKVFLNGKVMIADSVFRNTGCDMFIQRVKLFKGENPLLIKLGHEWGLPAGDQLRLSNFSIRFLDNDYVPVKDIKITTEMAKPHPAAEAPSVKRPQPIVDSIVAVLGKKLEEKPDDADAALLLMHFYNSTESTDESQKLIHAWLRRYPQSSLLHSMLQESLWRSKKYTDAQTAAKAAYRAGPDNFTAWATELNIVAESEDTQRIVRFIEQSPPNCRSSFTAEYHLINAYINLNNRNAFLDAITRLEKSHLENSGAVSILASMYVQQGKVNKAKKIIRSYLKYDRTHTSLYRTLSETALKSGNVGQAIGAITDGLLYNPVDADAYFYLARLSLYTKKYHEALAYIDKALAIMPTGAGALNLKGAILEAMSDRKGAETAYADAISFTNDDFNAWDNLRRTQNKTALDSLAPLPSMDSLLHKSETWKQRDYENGAILSYIDDIFYYPSKCSKERQLLIVYLGTRKAIDNWKEYQCWYNHNFQTCAISRAQTVKADGSQVPADVSNDLVVFKSLQTGDAILLEWTVKNYYFGEMARHVWGETPFQLTSPVFDQRFRLITPCDDTIPYTVFGDSLSRSYKIKDDYRVVSITRPPYGDLVSEQFRASDWPGNRKVIYSTFSSWSSIVDWYLTLTAHVRDNTLEIEALFDSLTAGITSPDEKIRRIHQYITSAIQYSFVSFRQSGWIPQTAHDVVTTRIGDCKDMASLGKTLFEKAGIPAHLVLVNTGIRHFLDHATIGPNFNHCILSYELDGATRFVDFTDKDAPLGTLTMHDQAAMALIIAPGRTEPLLLPLDSASDRRIERLVTASLDHNGTLDVAISSLRTGVPASSFRNNYRLLSPEKRKLELHQLLTKDYPDVVLDTFSLTGVDTLSDSLTYYYHYRSKNTITISGATAIFPLHLPDALETSQYPTAEKRYTPIDITNTECGLVSQVTRFELAFPTGWKLFSLPQTVSLSSRYGTYRLAFSVKGTTLICERHSLFSNGRIIDVDEYDAFREYCNTVAKADAVQLVFTIK